ncbi:helicase-exonuclease AddAB subunit AddA [Clostridium formicaceticum]|uniref:ATP-dependent helicase/nuclease subunit A n=1 Tax=Clostridium formicaceticum TaxID=1497 RepID=A0AAC9RL62_9CLOT|nr:helicase-exonuclease AddAB subunit AddA [Clostridium formicaceticum]AOY74857.1 helicase-exonuclease AddAB subunit AddA [Clostridium formicaceticum]ARE89256.1 ATP-dependent helicase/nuclease subunit A [Clostridium formicaceticum]
MKQWTKEQKAAIEARGSNLLIAAAAGSGKTAVLVERIIKMILQDKIDIDKLLIVTFTNAAAGEMRERIADAIVKELEKKNDNEEHLRRQMTLLNKASIMTVHAFCIEVVKKHFHFIDIDPTFRIGDITEIDILQLEVIEELLEEEYEKNHTTFIELVETFGGTREDEPLQNLILKVYHFIQSQPKPYQWLREKVEDFNVDLENFEETPWVNTMKRSILIGLKAAVDLLKEAEKICNKPQGPYKYLEAIQDDLKQIEGLRQGLEKGIRTFYRDIENFKHKAFSRGKQEVDEVLKEAVKDLRDKSKDIIKSIKKDIFLLSPEEYVEDLKALHPLMIYLYDMVVDFERIYAEKKRERGIVDFNDLEHYALEILENEKAAGEYRDRFEYIFIDEYQDSNIVQETLIGFIKRENNLFMVGDVKQSIYRFRLADPTLFIDKYEGYQLEEEALYRKIHLAKNFRSRGEILDGVNFIFRNIMSKALGEIDYNKEAYLYQGGSFEPMEDASIEVNIIEKDLEVEEELEEEIEELEDIEVEAAMVAKRIRELLKEKIYDPEEKRYRNILYKDIVILMRTTQNWAQIFLETLTAENVPVYADVNAGYFEAVEISMFMNLLKIIDNKRQDLPLLSVMRSPIGKFTLEELIEIRVCQKEVSFFDAVLTYIENNQNSLAIKVKSFLARLTEWADEARFMKTDELIWKLFIDTGYFYYVGAMPGGKQKQANLRMLLNRASQFEKTSVKGLFNFIKFIEKLESSKGDMGVAKVLGEKDNVVRIMSVHKSKGLEFPVVFLAGMGKNFNLRDVHADLLLHKDLGLGPKFTDIKLRTYRDTIAKLAMKNKIKIESLSEEMRILYVALTRAVDKLILIGSTKKLSRQVEKWSKNTNTYMLTSARNYLDWIGMVLTKHPKGKVLREIAKIKLEPEKLFEDNTKFKVHLLSRKDIGLEKQEKTDKEEEIKEKLKHDPKEILTSYKSKIDQVLNWSYPHRAATTIPSKLSVSEIKKSRMATMESMGYKIPTLVRRPKFLESTKTFTAAERGTILHFVLQHIDLKEIEKNNNIEEQIQWMIVKELLTEEEAMTVEVPKIEGYFKSELGKRMLKATKVYREVPFNIKKKAKDVIEGLQGCEETLLVQGIIDCYFQEEDGLVLIDYKSDSVVNTSEEIKKKYEVQLELYREALEKITGKSIKESYLYLFDIDQGVKL